MPCNLSYHGKFRLKKKNINTSKKCTRNMVNRRIMLPFVRKRHVPANMLHAFTPFIPKLTTTLLSPDTAFKTTSITRSHTNKEIGAIIHNTAFLCNLSPKEKNNLLF